MREQGKKSFFDMSIKAWLLAGFIVLIVPLIVVMLFTLNRDSEVQSYSEYLLEETLPTILQMMK